MLGDSTTTKNVRTVYWAICRLPSSQDRRSDMMNFSQFDWTRLGGKITSDYPLKRSESTSLIQGGQIHGKFRQGDHTGETGAGQDRGNVKRAP